MTKLSGNNAILKVGDYHLENNAWGTENPLPPQHIFGPPDDSISWHWDWPAGSADKVMAYPEIIYGKKPFNRTSSTTALPRAIRELNTLNVDFSFQTSATGAFNSTFDLWITNSSSATQADITAEVMIWLSKDGLTPAGSRNYALNTPTGCSSFHSGRMQHWDYFAFVLNRTITEGNVDLKPYIDFLVNEGAVSADHFLASVEFGNEIAFGKGATKLVLYSVDCS